MMTNIYSHILTNACASSRGNTSKISVIHLY